MALSDRDRLHALRRTGLLDTAPEPAFDRLTLLARRVLRVPVAMVSLVDDRRGFAKSRAGEVPAELPLSHSLCARVVDAGAPLVVDALTDHPAATDLGVGAYAGVPLALPGGPVLGSFCVADTRPRGRGARTTSPSCTTSPPRRARRSPCASRSPSATPSSRGCAPSWTTPPRSSPRRTSRVATSS